VVERRIGAGKKIKGDRIAPLRKAADGQLTRSRDWNDFQQRLSKVGIGVIPHLGKDGNLFGISFLDTRSRTIYTGSELGKSFTAGALKTSLGANYQAPSEQPVESIKPAQQPGVARAETGPAESAADDKSKQQPEQGGHHELMRQLLYALGENTADNDSEQDLKRMLRKARKPRLS
jgi:hypothetical protein